MAAMMPSAFTPFEGCMSEAYLGAAAHTARCFTSYRDKYAAPGGEMWVTESGDAGAGSGSMRSRTMRLNGRELVLGEKDTLPDLSGKTVSGELTVAPGGCTFIML